ncbi:23S rRNA (adenine(2503)-C(2))-methyltransferase RlmN [Lichenifustis flavocetrariae]|uniref:Dual-specificity RNA methyltransferase RlmN n=1 Tax=Lichenifustis flavocetrariae TaxID=2949735 RepID=A0AA42CNY8_9HYPH|nr:23S rRNA (adenine(2503)-C(2))-methyltransferase RlmN [Lichenifustis flavocetrariae]MCW6509887.1 23S rRNA (adenine(2503)-C(2))-methyltransferase RlmN [Lichenifustis flavocetrariae]
MTLVEAPLSGLSLPGELKQLGPAQAKLTLAGMTREELATALRAIDVPEREIRMRVAQVWHWIYFHGLRDFDGMLNVAKGLRARLAEAYTLDRPDVVTEQVSVDGTRKWLIRLAPTGPHDRGAEVECVYIPESDRGTLCVSSQVGCTLTCTFCHTGTQKLVRNLTSAEIVAQLLVARDRLGDFPGLTAPTDGLVPGEGNRAVSNIVFMGMGEPLYNLDHVTAAIGIMADGEGLSLSRRRITVSTSGVVPQIGPLGATAGTMLAISLHATHDALRDELVPLNRKYPIADLLQSCRTYPGVSNARRITFEYVMLKGVNDSLAEAKALVRLLKGIPAKINLIPFNPWPGSRYECSEWNVIERFSDVVFNAGYASPVRTPRGRDILAACGQLKSETEKLRARARLMLEAGDQAEPSGADILSA